MSDELLHPLVSLGRPSRNNFFEADRNPFSERFGQLSDAEWEAVLKLSAQQNEIESVWFPGFPADEIQVGMHGTTSKQSVEGAMKFYRFIQNHAEAHGGRIGAAHRLVDFGSGWGRMLRPFMRDVALSNLIGLEPNPWFCMLARGLNPYVSFLKSEYLPPAPIRSGSVDAVISWSVFSHLGERLARAWLHEFSRISRPGARLYLTTWGARFFDTLLDAKTRQGRGESIHFYHDIVLKAMGGDPEHHRRQYERGEFVFLASQGTETYGEAWISEKCMARMIPYDMQIISHDTSALSQDVFVLQRT